MIFAYYDSMMSVLSTVFWLLFMNELYFLVGSREQGYISPEIIYGMSFLLSAITAYHSPLNSINKILLFAGMVSITIGTRDEYYKCYVMLGLSLCWIALYYNYMPLYSSFGYIQSPTNNYGNSGFVGRGNGEIFGGPATHLGQRDFSVGRPVPSNYTF